MQVLTEHRQQTGRCLLRRCPISGARLSPTNHTGNYIYMLFQMDAGMGKNLQTGTFRTAAQVLPVQFCIVSAALAVRHALQFDQKRMLPECETTVFTALASSREDYF